MNTVAGNPAGASRRVAVISPVVATGAIDVEATLAPFRSAAFTVENFFIQEGPRSIENESDIAACLPGLLQTGAWLATEGWDAMVINCMCDPGVPELRARLRVPVLGPAQTSMHAAAALGSRFSILDVVSDGREFVENQVAHFGLERYFVSHRAIDVPVLELFRDPAHTVAALETQALQAFEDGADTVILGCTGLAGLAERLRQALKARGIGNQVMDPLPTTLAIARALLQIHAAEFKSGAGPA